jgi:hypothetical protein
VFFKHLAMDLLGPGEDFDCNDRDKSRNCYYYASATETKMKIKRRWG